MGRRALPRIDVDETGHLLTPSQLPRPWRLEPIFGCTGPFEMEVGSGKGLFLQNASRAQPNHLFLGVEIAGKYARFAAARLARDGCDNARVLHGDAGQLLPLIPDQALHAIHIYFPDPWWKKRHRRRRIMNEVFLQDVQRALSAGGCLHFWTDVEEFYREGVDLLCTVTDLEGPREVAASPALHDLDYRTHFERRVRRNCLPVFRAEFVRPSWRVQLTAGVDDACEVHLRDEPA